MDDEDELSEDDLFEIPKAEMGAGTWVAEGSSQSSSLSNCFLGKSDEHIIDFLSSGASKHVLSADPSKLAAKKRFVGFWDRLTFSQRSR